MNLQEEATTLLQHSILDNDGKERSQIVITKKEVVLPTEEKISSTSVIHESKSEKEFVAISNVDEDTHYEVLSPKINEPCAREIPIILDDRKYMIPSQVSKDAEETEVKYFKEYLDLTLRTNYTFQKVI